MVRIRYPLKVLFYRSVSGNEPVREWLKEQTKLDRKIIGTDIKTVQFGWPLGMPLIRKLEKDLWELRSNMEDGIARVIFAVHENSIILLHGFMKKSKKTSANDLNVARKRAVNLRGKQ